MSDYYEIPTWKDYQHYKDRDPPWIKLHFSLLTSPTWVMLDDASRALAIACMLIASRNHGKVPSNPDYIKRVAYLNSVNFKPLIENGFLVPCKQMLADASESKQEQAKATTEKSREDIDAPDKPAPKKGTQVPKDFRPNETSIRRAEELGVDWEAELPNFIDHHSNKGTIGKDWNAGFRTWLSNAVKFGAPKVVSNSNFDRMLRAL